MNDNKKDISEIIKPLIKGEDNIYYLKLVDNWV